MNYYGNKIYRLGDVIEHLYENPNDIFNKLNKNGEEGKNTIYLDNKGDLIHLNEDECATGYYMPNISDTFKLKIKLLTFKEIIANEKELIIDRVYFENTNIIEVTKDINTLINESNYDIYSFMRDMAEELDITDYRYLFKNGLFQVREN